MPKADKRGRKPTFHDVHEHPRHGTPRFRASRARASLPRAAVEQWQEQEHTFKVPFAYGFPATGEELARFKDMQQYLHGEPVKVGKGTVLWRGTDPATLQERKPLSTTTRPEVAMGFCEARNGKMYRVHVPEGTAVLPIGGDEHEILLPPGRLQARGDQGGKRHRFVLGRTRSGQTVSDTRTVRSVDYMMSKGRSGRPTFNPATSAETLTVSEGHRYSPGSSYTVSQQSSTESTGASAPKERQAPQRRVRLRRGGPGSRKVAQTRTRTRTAIAAAAQNKRRAALARGRR